MWQYRHQYCPIADVDHPRSTSRALRCWSGRVQLHGQGLIPKQRGIVGVELAAGPAGPGVQGVVVGGVGSSRVIAVGDE